MAMDYRCPDIVRCSWWIPKFSSLLCFKAPLSFSYRHTFTFPSTHTMFLISFHTHFLTKRGKNRRWRERVDAFTQFISGHPSLCCFCPRLILYSMPFQPGAPYPNKLISLFRILSDTLNLRKVYNQTLTHIHSSGNCMSLWFMGNLLESRTVLGLW